MFNMLPTWCLLIPYAIYAQMELIMKRKLKYALQFEPEQPETIDLHRCKKHCFLLGLKTQHPFVNSLGTLFEVTLLGMVSQNSI